MLSCDSRVRTPQLRTTVMQGHFEDHDDSRHGRDVAPPTIPPCRGNGEGFRADGQSCNYTC